MTTRYPTADDLPLFTCPYGCGAQHQFLHQQCLGAEEKLPFDKRIDLKNGLRGGLPADHPLPDTALTLLKDRTLCRRCFKPFKSTHVKCDGVELPPELQIHGGVVGGPVPEKKAKEKVRSGLRNGPRKELDIAEMPEVECPYGCGQKFTLKHVICREARLPREKRIDLASGLRGGLPAEHPLPKKTAWKMRNWQRCGTCGELYQETHNACDDPAKPYVPSLKRSAPTAGGNWLYWVAELTLRTPEHDRIFATMEELIEFVLAQKSGSMLVWHEAAWLEGLKGLLPASTTVKPEGMHCSLQPQNIRLRDSKAFAIKDCAKYAHFDRIIHELTGIHLAEKWTLAQLGYDYWKQLTKKEGHDIRLLEGAALKMSHSGYYGARIFAEKGEWRSSLLEAVEAERTYDDLLADPATDIKLQLDVSSMYPALLRGFDKLETWYPMGPHRQSEEGEAEFAKGTVGLYQVHLVRPEGLPSLGVLPIHTSTHDYAKRWPSTPGEGYGTYTEVDIELAQQYGYEVSFDGPCVLWDDTGSPFTSWADTLYGMKADAPDPDTRWVAKQLLVSLHGKLGQKDKGAIVENHKEVSRKEAAQYLEQGIPVVPLDGKYYLVQGRQTEQELTLTTTKPNHLSCWMQSWSRVLLAMLYEIVGWEEVEFTHTDCLWVTAKGYHALKEEGWVDERALGLLKVEYGVILESKQWNANKYNLRYLTREGELEWVHKGRQDGEAGEGQ